MESNPWKRTGSRSVYTNNWISVREDSVVCPDGTDGIYGVVEMRNATGVVALTEDNFIYLIGQYRYPIEEYSWEIVEGGTERGERPFDAARRELREEAGLEAGRWDLLGPDIFLSNCVSNERGVLFLAQDLTEVPKAPEATEILQVKKLPFTEALAMVDDGRIKDAMSVIAILRLARVLAGEEAIVGAVE